MTRRALMVGWVGVAVIGLLVVGIVVGLQLFPRLGASQQLIDDVRPALTADRVDGDVAGIAAVSVAVNLLDPAMYPGDGDAEWSQFIAVLAEGTHRSEADASDRLEKYFPNTVQLMNSMPLSQVAAEVPGVMEFIARTMNMTLDQWYQVLAKELPRMNQQVENLPKMTAGWNEVPGTEKLTRFDGAPARTMPQIRDYFQQDMMPALERQQTNFRALDTRGGVAFLAPLLLALGIVTMLFGALMALATAVGLAGTAPQRLGWLVVSLVGVGVVGLVFALNLFPRLDGGQRLLDGTRKVFTADRVDGARAGVDFLTFPINALGPGVLRENDGAGEVVKLLVMLSEHTGMTPLQVKALLKEQFPHATNLLAAEPFSDATAEHPQLYAYVAGKLELPPGQGQQWIKENFPKVHQILTNLDGLTSGWAEVPGTGKLTRFDGEPVRAVPELRDYFSEDVIPVLMREQANFARIDRAWPPMPAFAPLLTFTGLFVTLYGLLFSLVSWAAGRRKPDAPQAPQLELTAAPPN